MSDAEGNPEENGATPVGADPAVNSENANAEVEPDDPMAGYKEQIPVAQSAPEGGSV
jgi:hypothetical protein